MKERPIFENKEPKKNLVELNNADKKIVTMAFEVFQVLEKGYVLEKGLSNTKYGCYNGPVYLLKDSNHHFVEDEIVKASKGKIFRQVDVYSYTTRGGKVFGTEVPLKTRQWPSLNYSTNSISALVELYV